MPNNYKYSDLTDSIIQAFYKVYNTLGFGFLEKVYQNALLIELNDQGLKATAETPIDVYYCGQKVGIYVPDIIVNNCIIVELKAVEILCAQHEAVLMNYLKATNKEVGLLLNFGKQPQIKRRVLSTK